MAMVINKMDGDSGVIKRKVRRGQGREGEILFPFKLKTQVEGELSAERKQVEERDLESKEATEADGESSWLKNGVRASSSRSEEESVPLLSVNGGTALLIASSTVSSSLHSSASNVFPRRLIEHLSGNLYPRVVRVYRGSSKEESCAAPVLSDFTASVKVSTDEQRGTQTVQQLLKFHFLRCYMRARVYFRFFCLACCPSAKLVISCPPHNDLQAHCVDKRRIIPFTPNLMTIADQKYLSLPLQLSV